MGLGRFGGGVGVTRWLVAQGCDVLVTDLDPAERLAASLAAIDDLVRGGAVGLRLGGHTVSDFTDTGLVVANPAVPMPWDNRFLRAAAAGRVPITTEMRLTVERLPAGVRTIGVTGSVGKSTTSAMIAHVLRAAGRNVFFGGNIGGSLLSLMSSARDRGDGRAREGSHAPDEGVVGGTPWSNADVVLELSSAMLHWLSRDAGYPGAAGWSPHVAVVTNIAPNHLDWHGEFGHYERSKQQILRDQRPGDAAILPESLASWLSSPSLSITPSLGHRLISGADLDAIPPLAIPGRHNRMNAAFALAAAGFAGVGREAAVRALASFPGLPDRLQFLGEFVLRRGGVIRAYNDSKSTTPDATRLAVDAMEEDSTIGARRVRLICGGYDKKIDLTPLALAAARCAAAYTIGATGLWLAEAISAARGRALWCESLEAAVDSAAGDAAEGDVLLLSPGCASWDQFINYEERGRRFGEVIRNRCGVNA
jgi:UDP-N-acetylmuramoylalanine--D-glutamate ligase